MGIGFRRAGRFADGEHGSDGELRCGGVRRLVEFGWVQGGNRLFMPADNVGLHTSPVITD
jgi:hypothetical protein